LAFYATVRGSFGQTISSAHGKRNGQRKDTMDDYMRHENVPLQLFGVQAAKLAQAADRILRIARA
jgi:hypothetical protein